MSRSRFLLVSGPAVVAALLIPAGSAFAQGTMTPSQPPADTTVQQLPPPAPPPPGTPAPPPPSEPVAGGGGGRSAAPAQQEPAGPADAPPARTGFQIGIRSGAAIPMGETAKDSSLNDTFGPQFAFTLDIGGKVIPNLFLGGYLGLNIGGAGGKRADACDRANASCAGVSLRIGIEAQYHIIPDGKLNPWVGYGIGFESSAVSQSVNGSSVSQSIAGPEYAHLMGGLDFRLSKIFGIGPFIDFSIAQYSTIGSSGGTISTSGDIKDKALHQWLTLGAKFLFFP